MKSLFLNFKTVKFYTTKYVLNLTRALSQTLLRECKMLTTDIICDTAVSSDAVRQNRMKPDELLFILIPQLMVTSSESLPEPNKYCVYQLEQLNDKNKTNTLVATHFNAVFLSLLRDSLAAFDYSSVNLKYYPEHLQSKMRVLPPPVWSSHYSIGVHPIVENCGGDSAARKYRSDILFYGSMNERRERILTQLRNRVLQHRGDCTMLVINRVFGDELMRYISNARIVLNLHFYPNSILETDRIHAALQFNNVTVISEYPTQRDALLPIYESFPQIKFCNEIEIDDTCCNVDDLADACIRAINNHNHNHNNNAHSRTINQLNALCDAEMRK